MGVRIIGGQYRGMRINAPESARPTLVRHRQAIFDTLESIESEKFGHFFDNKIVIDCFAGSGALGIEAVSRGAVKAYLIDQNHEAITLLHDNVSSISDKFKIIRSDLLKLRNNERVVCDIAFIDPPYGKISINKIIKYLSSACWIDNDTLIVIEEDNKQMENLNNCNVLIEKTLGNSVFRFVKMQ